MISNEENAKTHNADRKNNNYFENQCFERNTILDSNLPQLKNCIKTFHLKILSFKITHLKVQRKKTSVTFQRKNILFLNFGKFVMQNLYGRIRFFLKIQIWMHPDPQQRNFFLPFVKVNLYFFSNFRSIFIESYAMKSINLFLIFISFFWVERWEVKNTVFRFVSYFYWKCGGEEHKLFPVFSPPRMKIYEVPENKWGKIFIR